MEKYDAGKAARDNFLEGYNCSQSVYMALAPLVGKDRMSAARTSAFLGGGICRTRNMCGAVLGMLMACGDADGNILQGRSTNNEPLKLLSEMSVDLSFLKNSLPN